MMDDVDDTVAPHVRRLRRRAVLDRLHGSLLFLPLTLLVAGVVLQETARRYRPEHLRSAGCERSA